MVVLKEMLLVTDVSQKSSSETSNMFSMSLDVVTTDKSGPLKLAIRRDFTIIIEQL